MDVSELQNRLKQLETQKMKEEMQSRRFLGDLNIPMMRDRQAKTKGDNFNVGNTKRYIALIKTILNIKLKP